MIRLVDLLGLRLALVVVPTLDLAAQTARAWRADGHSEHMVIVSSMDTAVHGMPTSAAAWRRWAAGFDAAGVDRVAAGAVRRDWWRRPGRPDLRPGGGSRGCHGGGQGDHTSVCSIRHLGRSHSRLRRLPAV
ncbi:hypothetical protein ACFUNF_20935 [Streptomyces sp. NPDC057291]|uniref:hypothetical protein n=1 Tax=Streptomyces sp. NPDC057291 TaxID=3346087 RepID=UPI003625C2A5